MTVKTRFAPSPTGDLHIGSARVALYCYLYAKHCQGKFVLRIEDTDLERSTDASVEAILQGMQWLQLPYEEGPYFQTHRMERYKAVLTQLLETDHAYRCYCSKERLEALREAQMQAKEKPRYDGHCLSLKEKLEGPYVIRFKNPKDGEVCFQDVVRGEIVIQNTELDDLILARSDGSPTYNFTVVVDDWDMQITHVIRGDDHINNTPRQVNIFKALGAQIPTFAHLPMILGEDGKRLSKRHGATSVMQYREAGILPQALLNYLVRLGWSHGDQEIFSRAEMIEFFDLSNISHSAAMLNWEKLLWLNQQYLKTEDPAVIAPELAYQFQVLNIDVRQGPALIDMIQAQAERCKTLKEMAEKSCYFYEEYQAYDEKAAKKHLSPTVVPLLTAARDLFLALPQWSGEAAHQVILDLSVQLNMKLGDIAQPLRLAITGGVVSPPMDVTLGLIGQRRVVERINRTIQYCAELE